MTEDCSITQGSNFANVTVGKLELAFSYKTVIGFASGARWVISENLWGPTTGKHINALPSGSLKSTRVSRPDFEEQLNRALKRFGLID